MIPRFKFVMRGFFHEELKKKKKKQIVKNDALWIKKRKYQYIMRTLS